MSTTVEEPTVQEQISATPAEVFGDELPPDQTPEPTSPEPTPTPEPTPPPTSLTSDQIRDSVRDGMRAAAPAQPEKQYTQEEIDAHFHVWQPTPDLVERIRHGGEDGLKALVEIREGLSKQFIRLVQLQSEVIKGELSGQFTPALKFVSDANAAEDRAAFFKEHEDLKDHEALVQTVFNALKAEGYSARDKAEAYKTLADRTRKLLPTAASNGSGDAQSGAARTATTTQPVKRPAALSSGSQAGGGGGNSAPATGYPGGEVFL